MVDVLQWHVMRYLSIVVFLVIASCDLFEPTPCSSDMDCKGDRVCVNGECYGDVPDGDGLSSGSGVSEGLACGQTAYPCDCYGYGPYEGEVLQDTLCESGLIQVLGCYDLGYCYDGSLPYGAVCFCE